MAEIYRIKYGRDESVKFVSHLDTVQVFNRAARRANLPLEYSKGYNPHPLFVFGHPAFVGLISEAEYVDVTLYSAVSCQDIINKMNDNLPLGFRILECEKKEPGENIMALIASSEYLIEVNTELGDNDINKAVDALMSFENINMMKKTKKGLAETDIKPLIKAVELAADNDITYIKAVLVSSNERSLKPQLLIEAFNRYQETDFRIKSIRKTKVFFLN